MSFALDRQAICDTWFKGFARPGGQWFIHPGSYGWTDALAADTYDPQKAKALLAEAGYPNGTIVHIYTTTDEKDFILLLANYWEVVGIQPKIEVVDSTTWGAYFFSFNRLKGGEPNAGWIFTWTYSSFFNSVYHAANMYCSNGVHNSSNDPTADYLYNKAAKELDPKKAVQYYAEFQVYARSMYVNIGIAEIDTLLLVGPELGEFTGKTYMSLYDCYNAIQHKLK
jgi:peptide/nickel transport system substrate-binding protein